MTVAPRTLTLAYACAAVLAIAATPAAAATPASPTGAALRARYAELRDNLAHSPFGKPLRLESTKRNDTFAGAIDAVLDFPFERVRSTLVDVRDWCEILILHPNIEACHVAGPSDGAASITVDVGGAHVPVTFSYRVGAANGDFLSIELRAAEGPFGTTDYRIDLEAAPLDGGHTIVHFTFSQQYGTPALLAMQAYLATFARDKVGFTVVGHAADGTPRHVGGLRGALERNVMRYYAAIEAYIASLSAPAGEQREARLRHWYAYTRRYPAQLAEEPGYLEQKHAEIARQPPPS